MKPDGLFKRNHLAGAAGDAINAVLALAGHNLRLLLAWLRMLCAWILAALRSSFRRFGLPIVATVLAAQPRRIAE